MKYMYDYENGTELREWERKKERKIGGVASRIPPYPSYNCNWLHCATEMPVRTEKDLVKN